MFLEDCEENKGSLKAKVLTSPQKFFSLKTDLLCQKTQLQLVDAPTYRPQKIWPHAKPLIQSRMESAIGVASDVYNSQASDKEFTAANFIACFHIYSFEWFQNTALGYRITILAQVGYLRSAMCALPQSARIPFAEASATRFSRAPSQALTFFVFNDPQCQKKKQFGLKRQQSRGTSVLAESCVSCTCV